MDRQRLSAIAHRRHPIACPFSDAKVGQLIDHLQLPAAASALDIGCGHGEWLNRILVGHDDARGVGIDQSAHALDAARSRTSALGSRLQLEQIDAGRYIATCSSKFDLVLCAGSTHALGGYAQTLDTARSLLTDRGQLLIAEGFWQHPPSPAALTALDAKSSDLANLDGTIRTAVDAGYTPYYSLTSNQDEWDHYEWSWCGSLERYARDNPRDPDIDGMLEAARMHRDGYLTGYRGVLGFTAMIMSATRTTSP